MRVLSLPAIYALELTPACNSRCPGCGNNNPLAAAPQRPAPMSSAEWQRILAPFIHEAVQFRLTGGEPTLHPGFFEILRAVTDYDAWVTVFTNGRWRHPREMVGRLRGWPHLSGLLVSLHGARRETHESFTRVSSSFDETVANIRLAVDAGVSVTLSTVITSHTWEEIEGVLTLAQEIGATHIAFNRYIGPPLPGIEPSTAQLRAAVARIEALRQAGEPVKYGVCVPQCLAPNGSEGCLAGAAYAHIDPWGNVRPCAHSPTVAGNLRELSMSEIWHGDRMAQWRALLSEACLDCAAISICHGGCRAMPEITADRRDPLRTQPLQRHDLLPTAASSPRHLPATARPRAGQLRLRPESFGYAAIGNGQIMLVKPEARPIIEACQGDATFAELVDRFGPGALNLLGELWDRGML